MDENVQPMYGVEFSLLKKKIQVLHFFKEIKVTWRKMYLSSFFIFASSVSWKFSCPATTVLLLDVVPLQTNKKTEYLTIIRSEPYIGL